MPTHPVYDQLLQSITVEETRKVLQVLIDAQGQAVTWQAISNQVYGTHYPPDFMDNNNPDWRKVRKNIETLRDRCFPITANSGGAGYSLTTDRAEIDKYESETRNRIKHLEEKLDAITVMRSVTIPKIAAAFQERAASVEAVRQGRLL